MKLAYKRDEHGDYDVFAGRERVGEIYRSALARFWVVEAGGSRSEGYVSPKDAKADFERLLARKEKDHV